MNKFNVFAIAAIAVLVVAGTVYKLYRNATYVDMMQVELACHIEKQNNANRQNHERILFQCLTANEPPMQGGEIDDLDELLSECRYTAERVYPVNTTPNVVLNTYELIEAKRMCNYTVKF